MLSKIKHYFGLSSTEVLTLSEETIGNLYILPLEILHAIFSLLPLRDFPKLVLVSKNVKLIAESCNHNFSRPAHDPEIAAFNVRGTYRQLLPLLNKIREVSQREKFAYTDEKEKTNAITSNTIKMVKYNACSYGLCLLIGIIRALLIEQGLISRNYPKDTTAIIASLSFFCINMIGSSSYLFYKSYTSTSKERLHRELEETIVNYTKKQN